MFTATTPSFNVPFSYDVVISITIHLEPNRLIIPIDRLIAKSRDANWLAAPTHFYLLPFFICWSFVIHSLYVRICLCECITMFSPHWAILIDQHQLIKTDWLLEWSTHTSFTIAIGKILWRTKQTSIIIIIRSRTKSIISITDWLIDLTVCVCVGEAEMITNSNTRTGS